MHQEVIFGARGAVNKASFYFDKDEEKIKPILGHIYPTKRGTPREVCHFPNIQKELTRTKQHKHPQ
jgi:hypothetical protein